MKISENKHIQSSVINELIKKTGNLSIDKDADISDEEVLTLIKAARLAPSADNSQIWRFYVIKDKDKISKTLTGTGLSEKNYRIVIIALAAPFIIRHVRREHPFYAIDVPIAITHILLQAQELGIKADIHYVFERNEINDILKIPLKYKPVAIIGLNRYADK